MTGPRRPVPLALRLCGAALLFGGNTADGFLAATAHLSVRRTAPLRVRVKELGTRVPGPDVDAVVELETETENTSEAEGTDVPIYRRAELLASSLSGKRRGGAVRQILRGVDVRKKRKGMAGGVAKAAEKKEMAPLLSDAAVEGAIRKVLGVGEEGPATNPWAPMGRSAAVAPATMGILGEGVAPPEPFGPIRAGRLLLRRPPISVHIALPRHDDPIAGLRLSVFNPCASGDFVERFVRRSLEVIADRRDRGATIILAADEEGRVVGSVELSVHEFYGTSLGAACGAGTVAYVTEVAVCSDFRRQGAGAALFEALHAFARSGGVTSLYLHVDVCNVAAIALYKKCGYTDSNQHSREHYEFTRGLNLHDGATGNKRHVLMYANLKRQGRKGDMGTRGKATRKFEGEKQSASREGGMIGFDIPSTM